MKYFVMMYLYFVPDNELNHVKQSDVFYAKCNRSVVYYYLYIDFDAVPLARSFESFNTTNKFLGYAGIILPVHLSIYSFVWMGLVRLFWGFNVALMIFQSYRHLREAWLSSVAIWRGDFEILASKLASETKREAIAGEVFFCERELLIWLVWVE